MAQPLESSDPRQVGPYRIMGRLGAGGMGRVYLGRSPGGRAVAVKTVRPELTDDPEFRERFAREAAAARAVSGAFTAAVVDADPYGDPPWLATVHVAGISLADTIARHGPLPGASVLALGAGLSEALQAIHAAGLVHRDLKPSNVLLAPDGPKVIDFGIAITAGSSSLTRSGVVVGTPAFMSPEQLTGGRAGAPADVFALGGVLYFAATGESPFGYGPTAGVGYRVVHDQPSLATVPEGLRPLLTRCLEKDPAGRPTVAELLAEFADRVLPAPAAAPGGTDTITLAFHGGAWLPAPVAASVWRAEAAGAAPVAEAVTSTAVPGGAAGPLLPVQPPAGPVLPAAGDDRRDLPYPGAAPQGPGPVPPGGTTVPGPVGDGDRDPGGPNRRQVLAALAGAAGVTAAGAGAYLLGRGDNHPGKGSNGATLKDPNTSASSTGPAPGSLKWTHDTGGPVAPALLAAGGLVYAGSKDANLYALNAETGEPRWTFGTGNGVYTCPAVAGGVAYFGSADYHLYAVDVTSGRQLWLFSTGGEVNSSPVVAGGVVYAGSDDGNLYAVNARTGERKWTYAAGGRIRSSPVVAWGKVYVGSEDSRLHAVDVRTGARRWTFGTDGDVKSSPAIADRVVYVGSYDGNLYAVSCDTGERQWAFATRGGVGSSPAVSGGAVYVGSDDGHLYAVDARTGKQRWTFTVGAIVYSSPAVLGDVVYVGSKNGNLYALRTNTGEQLWTFPTGADIRSSPTAAGGTVYVGNDSGTVFAVNR